MFKLFSNITTYPEITFIYRIFLVLFIFIFPITCKLLGDNKESEQLYTKGLKLMKEGRWKSAADEFKAAKLYADSYILKANATKKAAESYQKGKLYYQEFLCLKGLITAYPSTCNVDEVVKREYEIGNEFYDGYRETPYWWFPWIENDDKSLEIYESILKQSPYASFVPDMLLKMGLLYINDKKNQQAIDTYRKLIDKYPDTYAAKIAYLDLANIYIQYAESADGDGSNSMNARSLLLQFKKKYPDSVEMKWVEENIKKAYNLEAEQLYDVADYYNSNDNPKAARRYLKQILVNYPDSSSVNPAEEMLEDIDLLLYPLKRQTEKIEPSKYGFYSLPKGDEEDSILVIPENSGGKWLTPIDNLGMVEQKQLQSRYSNNL